MAPRIGEHSREVQREAGLSEADIQRSIQLNRQTRLARGAMVHPVPPGTSRDVLPELPSAVEG